MNDSNDDNHIVIPGYSTPIRCDRQGRRGEGVCVFYRDFIHCKVLSDLPLSPPWIECTWTHFPTFRIVLLSIYIPPSLTAPQLNSVVNYIIVSTDEELNQAYSCNVIIAGDLNRLPTDDIEHTLGLIQTVQFPTRCSAILDKILVDESLYENYKAPIGAPNFGKSDHIAVLQMPLLQRQTTQKIVKIYDYRESNMCNFVKS